MNNKVALKFLSRVKDSLPEDRTEEIFLMQSVIEGLQTNERWNTYIILGTSALMIGLILGVALGGISRCP